MNIHEKIPDSNSTIYGTNVELYDIAFDWDLSDEVTWLIARLGPDCKKVLEPGCGSGRMLEAIAKRGIWTTGFDISPAAVAFAEKRILKLNNASVFVGDMVSFDLGESFDGAICPVNTLAHLTPEQLALHLKCMALHLRRGARYMVQVALREYSEFKPAAKPFEWEASRGETRLRMSVMIEEFDRVHSRELQRFRVEIINGPRAQEIIEESHWMTSWTSEAWQRVLNASALMQIAQYDGDLENRPEVKIGEPGNLMWHELTPR